MTRGQEANLIKTARRYVTNSGFDNDRAIRHAAVDCGIPADMAMPVWDRWVAEGSDPTYPND